MNERLAKAEAVFHEALELLPEQRESFLQRECGHDAELRAEVAALLRASGIADQWLRDDPSVVDKISEGPGTIIDRYKLREKVGEGGCGVVYVAEQDEPVRRRVALKIIKLGMDTKAVVARFEAERQALAMMDHPNIAKVLDAGTTDTGRPYFVMELVRGIKITEYCDQHKVATRERLELFIQVCQAVQHAHQKGIIHRDLKPSNILVTLHDGVPVPKVIDFGIAKATEGRLTEATVYTQLHQFIGTPAYMSPEQAEMSGLDIDTRTDIYSLGVLLYELLTGVTPFDAQTLVQSGLDEMRRIIREEEPKRPSTRLSTLEMVDATALTKHRQEKLPALVNLVRGDLDWIVMKCLEKDRTRRYETANGLAADLKRHLNNETVTARPPRAVYRFQKLVRRNRLAFVAASVIAVSLVLGVAVSTWQAVRATQAEHEQRRLRQDAELAKRNEAEQRGLAESSALKARQDLYAMQMKLAYAAFKAGKIGSARKLLQSLIPAPGKPDFRGFDWRFLYRLCQSSGSEVLATNAGGFTAADWSPDGRALALGTRDGDVELFEARTLRRLKQWRAHEGSIDDLAFCPRDSNGLVTMGTDGLLKIWDLARSRSVLTTNGSKGWCPFVQFSPSGRLLVTSAPNLESVNLWQFQRSTPGQAPTLTLKTNLPFVGPAAFSPDEQTLAAATWSTNGFFVALSDLNDQKVVTLPVEHVDAIASVAFSPDGQWLASGGLDERVVLWDLRQRKMILSATNDLAAVSSMAFAANGRALYVCGWGENLHLCEFANPNEILPMRGHSAGVAAIAISPDGAVLASAGRDGTARLWKLRSDEAASRALPSEFSTLLRSDDTKGPNPGMVGVSGVAVSPDQSKVVAVACTKLILCDLATGMTLATVSGEEVFPKAPLFGSMSPAAFSPDGRTLAVGSFFGELAFLDAATLRPLKDSTKRHEFYLSHVAFGLDGAVLATGGGGVNEGVVVTEFPSGGVLTNIVGLHILAVSADGQLLATGSPDNRVRVWDLESRRVVASSPLQLGGFAGPAFSPDGQWLAIAGRGTIFLWDYRGQRPLRKLVGHAGPVLSLAFSPDSRTLASCDTDHTIKLWHPDIDQEVATLTGQPDWVSAVTFAEQGNALISASRDGTLKVWRAPSFEEIAAAEAQEKKDLAR